jgi:hypothetical protein
MTDFGVEQARQRVLSTMYAGNWEAVDAQLTAYGAAVRAEERARVVAEALAALRDCAGDDSSKPVTDCLGAVARLQ